MASRACAWCHGEIDASARSDSIYCRKSCRQAAHRFRRGYRALPPSDEPVRVAYADPPYPGLSKRYYEEHPDFDGEVDHARLVEQLVDEFPDGWALSTSARALRDVWALCPPDVRLAPWVRGPRSTRSYLPLNAYEAVLWRGGRQALPSEETGATRRLDSLVYPARVRRTDPDRVVGTKPADFCWWLFDLLGLRPGDELVDLFPGSGGVSKAWAIATDGPPRSPWATLPLFDPSSVAAVTGDESRLVAHG